MTETTLIPPRSVVDMIVPGRASQSLAAALSAEIDRDLMGISRRCFPDGEQLIELEPDPGPSAIIVASTVSASAHIDLLLLQDALREAGTADITTVIPYLGYSRQDTAFEAGQPVSVRAMTRAIETGTDRIITVNPHEDDALSHVDIPTYTIDSAARLALPLATSLSDPVFLAPDEGAYELAETVCQTYGGGEIDYLQKTRHSDRSVEIAPKNAAVADRDVVLVDDIIATGGTMAEAIRFLKDRNARRIVTACIHPLLAEDAFVRLTRAGVDAIYGTDTLERTVSVVSVAPSIADVLDNIDNVH